MLLELAMMLFTATGAFTGSATCEKISDGVSVDLQMDVESNSPRIPSDSISVAMEKLLAATKTFNLKYTNLVILESTEGRYSNRNGKNASEKEYFARKTIKVKTTAMRELPAFLQYAAETGFLMNGSPEYYINNPDSLKTACLEKSTKLAIDHAAAAKRAMNGISMSILKITDSDQYSLYTSDDTQLDDEEVDGFFLKRPKPSHATNFRAFTNKSQMFYSIVPTSIKVTTTVKILVKITTND